MNGAGTTPEAPIVPPAPASTTGLGTGAGTAAALLCIAIFSSSCAWFKPSLAADEKACLNEALTTVQGDALGDIAPTVLNVMEIARPEEMTGASLFD